MIKKFLFPFLILVLVLGITRSGFAVDMYYYTVDGDKTPLGPYTKGDCESVRSASIKAKHTATVCTKILPMKITGFTPESGKSGDRITISGENFIGIEKVLIGTKEVTVFNEKDSKTINNVLIPIGSNTSKITIYGKVSGSVTSSKNFTITSVDKTQFYYKNIANQLMGKNGLTDSIGFDDLTSCSIARENYICEQSMTIPECFEKTKEQIKSDFPSSKDGGIPGNTPIVCDKNNESQDVPSVIIPGYNDTYKLLAPIGEYNEVSNEIGIGNYLNTIFGIIIGLCGVLAVIMIVIGGIQYMGQDSVFGKGEAKGKITAAIGGLLLALGAWLLLETINPDLLGKKGLVVKDVNIEIDEETIPWSTYDETVTNDPNLCPSGFVDTTAGHNAKPEKIKTCKSIQNDLVKMINDAYNQKKLVLSGAGARSIAKQKELRAENCGGASNIYNKKAKCDPDTALPGKSNHQKGLAVDFNCNGQTMMDSGGKNSPCYKWLKENASKYGFYNLKSEPWHWSVDGK